MYRPCQIPYRIAALHTMKSRFASEVLACLYDQNKSRFFGGPTFIQPIRAIKKRTVFKSSDWLEKSRPSKSHFCFDHV